MAGVREFVGTPQDGRFVAAWWDAGWQYRNNILTRVGAEIVWHVHAFEHLSLVRGGLVEVGLQLPWEPVPRIIRLASPGFRPELGLPDRVVVPAQARHRMKVIELAGDAPCEVECSWEAPE